VAERRALQEALAGRLFELTIVLGDLMARGLAERGLSRARATVISQLRERGPVVQRELSQALDVTPRNVTGLVDGLEAAGLVKRFPHPTDRRATLVRLTRTGERLAERLHADERQFGEVLFEGIRASDLSTMTAALDRVLERLHAMRSMDEGTA
jgi:DNA-binding MarR family transcriptional regulator